MKSVSGKEFSRLLERKGWQLMRISGSHHIYGKNGCRERISVPIHSGQSLKQGMLAYFLKVAGLTERDL